MKQSRLFVSAMTVSACLFFAGRMVVGSGGSDARPLAKSLGTATINECKVLGKIESRSNGVYAVFDFENPATDAKTIKFNYLATHTPPMSMVSRMGPRPETVRKGIVDCHLKPGSATEEVLLKEATAMAATGNSKPGSELLAAGTAAAAKPDMLMTPEIWSLVVSREEIKGIRGWGAVGPAASDAQISLDKGEAVLASTVLDKPAK